MKKNLFLLFFLSILSCKNVNDKSTSIIKTEKQDSVLEYNYNVDSSTLTLLDLDYPFLDSVEKNKFYKVLGDTINFSKIDSIVFYDSLKWMNEQEIEKYYQYDSLISKLKENYLYPFYYGLSNKKMNLYPVLIVIHSGDTEILSDYLLFNSNFRLVNKFTPSKLVVDLNITENWSGYFKNDSVFRQVRLTRNYEINEYVDSSIYEITIRPEGQIIEKFIVNYDYYFSNGKKYER